MTQNYRIIYFSQALPYTLHFPTEKHKVKFKTILFECYWHYYLLETRIQLKKNYFQMLPKNNYILSSTPL